MVISIMVVGVFPAQAEEYEITIPRGAYSPQCVKADNCFNPSSIQIPENSIVEWKNQDSAAHTIVSGKGIQDNKKLFESGILNYDDEFYVDFSSLGPGSYPYYCSIHTWMKGEIIVGEGTISDKPQPSQTDDQSSMEVTKDKSSEEMKMDDKIQTLSSERVYDNYTLRLDWIREFPVTNEVNGFELIVTDSRKVKMMMSNGGMGGGCGGGHGDETEGHSSHDDKGMKGKMSMDGKSDNSSHDDKGMSGGMGGHEGGCPHFKMVKKSIPKVAALESGVENLENSLKMEIIVQGQSYPINLNADNEFKGRYYALFIPTVASQYDVHLSGIIDSQIIDSTFNPAKVIGKNQIPQIP